MLQTKGSSCTVTTAFNTFRTFDQLAGIAALVIFGCVVFTFTLPFKELQPPFRRTQLRQLYSGQ